MKVIQWGGWDRCVHLSNGFLELIITVDVGPRILYCGLAGQTNLFCVFPTDAGQTGGASWIPFGGHRLWHAPERVPRTYAPDNATVDFEWDQNTLVLRPAVEPATGIGKEIRIELSPDGPRVRLTHRLTNQGAWDIHTAAWCLSVMAAGGRAILPQEPFIPFPDALLPARPLVLWSYTDMADSRYTWDTRYITIRQDASLPTCQKIGLYNSRGWGAYINGMQSFLKVVKPVAGAVYPDFHCNWEVYTNPDMLELETLSPLTRLECYGGSVEHVETWEVESVDSQQEDIIFLEKFTARAQQLLV